MSQKRARDTAEDGGSVGSKRRKQRKGFQVGPANLPDGIYKRKNKKIKDSLIQRAQLRREYAKVKAKAEAAEPRRLSRALPLVSANGQAENGAEAVVEPATEPHPDRQTLMDNLPPGPQSEDQIQRPRERRRKPKAVPFKREYEQAQQRKAEAEERCRVREEVDRQRTEKMEERERFRKTMAKARTGGKNGQRKLGRESTVLLERVQRIVKEGK